MLEEVLERIGEKRTLTDNVLRRKANWVGHILRRNCLHVTIKRVERIKAQLLDDLRNRRKHWELKEEAEDRKNMEKKIYQSNIRKKYKLSSICSQTC